MSVIQSLSISQLKEVDLLLSSLDNQEAEVLYAMIEGYEEPPVDIQTFIEDPYFAGNMWDPDQGIQLYPAWMAHAKDIFPHNLLPSPYITIVCSGSIGTGKSTFGYLCTLYNVYRMILLSNPQAYYKLGLTTNIKFAVFNVTKDLAEDETYSSIHNIVSASPFFKNLFTTKRDEVGLNFPKNISFVIASQASHLLSAAIAGGILDESNFEHRENQVYNAFTNASRRMESRFMKNGKVGGQLYLLSSNQTESDFTEMQAEKLNKSSNGKVIRMSLFEAQKHKPGVYVSGKWFKVFCGSKFMDPFIIDDDTKHLLPSLPSDRIIDVPEEHRDSFEKDLVSAIRDIAGMSTPRGLKYILDPEKMLKPIIKVAHAGPQNYITLTFDGPDQIMDFIDQNQLTLFLQENSYAPRYVHLDLSSTGQDAAGLGISYCSAFKEIKKSHVITDPLKIIKEQLADDDSEVVPIIRCELALGIKKADLRVPYEKIRRFIRSLSDYGFPITTISGDTYQSEDMFQIMQGYGYTTEIISCDKLERGQKAGLKSRPKPYAYFYNAMVENRVEIPNFALLEAELKDLNEIEGVVNHPSNGTKDICDGVVGSTYCCYKNTKLNWLM